MRSSWKAAFGIFLIFGLGCLSGALSTSVYFHENLDLLTQRNPGASAEAIETRLTHHLKIDAQQREQIHGILMDYVKQRRQFQARIQPDVQALNVQMIRQVRAALHPDQLAGFHQNITELRGRLARAGVRINSPEGVPDPIGGSDAAPSTNAPVIP
jgi:hypothetical protein